jgi:lipopolysaccharide export system protein LptC
MDLESSYISPPLPNKKVDTNLDLDTLKAVKIPNSSDVSGSKIYSRYVFFMKLLLPAIAIGLASLLFLWPQMKVMDTRFSINFKNIQNSDPEDLNMINARFVGTDSRNQPFSITADMAKNMRIGGTTIELEMPKADIGIDNGSWLAVIANSGIYNQKTQTLDLVGAVNLFHDSGYEFNTEKTTIDLTKNIASSDVKVNGQGPFGNLTAEGFRIEKKNNQYFFIGKTKLIFKPRVNKSINRQ